ncbi:phenylalanine--tRNA ligase subunit beta [Polymorphobacter fuscus]|uniref:Phenylalanine--tRNA ligase beta subunit n=1 Tax=Sandarakinorhabdus fusca TaxID=1439888 RepID=A0A7C9GQP5_9SPHN|nr:phenylalanine--tRNA ligase subunit beta [Polymorphobacter fuscus]KAB7644489.1 phenylalanine--tRNA ligase subunit beta [Polymorphobacter fuscus]MQT18417.1 phenylalanine--tRNA ligase subunit beta [Polymorphobacter fuscus]NJC08318.1 phenylalanyl-tRNA synthetase beta chain [Polymorphobacter fuscus]
MKFSLSWLKEHLDTDAGVDDLSAALTTLGLEVEAIDDPSAKLAAFTVAEVLSAAPHPQADKLQILSVSTGGEPMQVVCGAPNARAGMKGVFGAPGTYVPGSDITLKVAAIRGVESRGMMCSMRELELSDEHNGIIDLPADAPVGARYVDYAGLADPVFDVAITPNRQDCMGVRGIARDLAALGLGRLKPLAEAYRVAGFDVPRHGSGPDVRTDDPAGCPAFFACTVSGVTNTASPAWLQTKLRAIGQKPISALVDITNFVMFDLGRPLHVYDRAKLDGGLVARKAHAGEQVLALNGKTYSVDPTMTVIADNAMVHDIGGIMGGMHSGCSESTADVLIECAYFDPESIALTGQKLTLTSDARSRFERGVDPAFLDDGLAVATHLVLALCGGTASAVTRAGTPPVAEKTVHYRPSRVLGLAGIDVPEDAQADILTRLGFGVTRGERWSVTVPSWRRDVGVAGASERWDGEADLVEEVVRIHGLDRVLAAPLPRAEGVARPTATPAQKLERKLRRALAARGADEAVTWSFLPPAQADHFGGAAFTLANPISADMAAMRPSLLPGLLSAARRNQDRGASSVRLFELGQRYLASGERSTAALLLAGEARPRGWQAASLGFDAYDAKAEALAALAAAGAPVDRLTVAAPADPWWHPGRSGRLVLGKAVLADFGLVHPATLALFDLKGAVAAVELYLDALPPPRGRKARGPYAPPALQAVTRDFAFVADDSLAADALVRAAAVADKALITGVRVFDRFAGERLGAGKVSLAIEVTLQPTAATLTDADIEAVSAKVIAAAGKLGAALRG